MSTGSPGEGEKWADTGCSHGRKSGTISWPADATSEGQVIQMDRAHLTSTVRARGALSLAAQERNQVSFCSEGSVMVQNKQGRQLVSQQVFRNSALRM